MAKSRVPRVLGLATAPNEISSVQPGSLVQGDNVVIRDNGLVEPRRGIARFVGLADFDGDGYTPNHYPQSVSADGSLLHGSTTALTTPSALFYFDQNSATYTNVAIAPNVGTLTSFNRPLSPADNTLLRTRFQKFRNKTFLTSQNGLRDARLQQSYFWAAGASTPSTYRLAGTAQPPSLTHVYTNGPQGITGNPNATGSWLNANSSVSYRVVFGLYELPQSPNKGEFTLGAPSPRHIIRCPANQTGVTVARAGSSVVTATCASVHNLLPGDIVAVAPTVTTAFASSNFTVVSVPSTTTFTYNDATSTGTTTLAGSAMTVGPKYTTFRIWANDLRLGRVDGLVAGAASEANLQARSFYRIYRTKVNTAGFAEDPGDEHFLIAENVLTTTQLATGYVDITDTTPESGLGLSLYTNATDEGILQANNIPPFSKDVANWGERMWSGNTRDFQTLTIRLLGVGSPNGLQSGDELWVGETRFTVNSSLTFLGSTTPVVYSQFSSQSRNIEMTARSIVSAINAYRSVTDVGSPRYFDDLSVQGQINTPLTRYDTFPLAYYNENVVGEIILIVPSATAGAFNWYSSRSTCWARPPVTATTLTSNAGNVRATYAFSTNSVVNVQVTTTGAHGLTAGDFVVLKDNEALTAAGTLYGGVYRINAVPSATSFTYEQQPRTGDSAGTTTLSSATFYALYQSEQTFWQSADTLGKNRLYYSKLGEPESVPLVNNILVGGADFQILRITPLNDVLFVFKEDGLFAVSGSEPFSVDAFDPTCILVAPDSVVSLNNFIYCLTTKGVARVSNAGVEIISDPIDDLIQNRNQTYVKRYTCAAGVEEDNLYYLWIPDETQVPDTAFVYSTESDAWTTISKEATCAVYTTFDGTTYGRRLLVGASSVPYVRRERKTQDNATYGFPFLGDYHDEEYTVTISSVSSNGLNLTLNSVANVTTGAFINQGTTAAGLVTAVNGNVVTVVKDSSLGNFTAASATVSEPYQVTVRFVPDYMQSPDDLKQYRDLQLLFQRRAFYEGDATFSSELQTTTLSVPVQFTDANVRLNRDIASVVSLANDRIGVPRGTARCVYLTTGFSLKEAYSFFRLAGYALVGDVMSERVNR